MESESNTIEFQYEDEKMETDTGKEFLPTIKISSVESRTKESTVPSSSDPVMHFDKSPKSSNLLSPTKINNLGFFGSLRKFFQKCPVAERKNSAHEEIKEDGSIKASIPSEENIIRQRSRSQEIIQFSQGDVALASPSTQSKCEQFYEQADDFSNRFSLVEDIKEEYLVLLVHGIGTQEQHQAQHIVNFKASLQKIQDMYFKGSQYDFVIKMVDWKSLLNTQNTKEKVQKVTIQEGSSSVREIVNETVVDILFYLSQAYRDKILQKIADEANKYYFEVSRQGQNRKFKGKVSVVAHSLGTVISYDLLLRQQPQLHNEYLQRGLFQMGTDEVRAIMKQEYPFQLIFQLEHFFLLGSPLGLFVSIYNEECFMRERLPTCKFYYNIYHPLDPVAYRIEPLFQVPNQSEGLEKLPPVMLPYYKNNGFRPINQFNNFVKLAPNSIVQSALNTLSEVQKQYMVQEKEILRSQSFCGNYGLSGQEPADSDMSPVTFKNAPDLRFDYCMQEKGIATIIKPVGLLQSHVGYFKDRDVAFFIMKKIHRHCVPTQI